MSVNYNLETGVKIYHDLIPYALAQGIIDFLYDTTWKIGWSDKGWYDADVDAKYFYHDFVQNIDGEMVGTTPIKVTVQPRVIEIFR